MLLEERGVGEIDDPLPPPKKKLTTGEWEKYMSRTLGGRTRHKEMPGSKTFQVILIPGLNPYNGNSLVAPEIHGSRLILFWLIFKVTK